MRKLLLVAMLALPILTGCSEESQPAAEPPGPIEPPPVEGCVAGEWEDDSGACQAAGTPPDGCGEGFESDGGGSCNPVLPAESCAPGTMALPGETVCRPVAECGDAPWGNAPMESGAQYVDANFTGTSTGSASAPWTVIQDAVDAATAGGLVVIAAGTYSQGITISGKTVRVWGRCPDMVDIAVSTANGVQVQTGADGSELRGFALRNGGFVISGSQNLLLDSLWVHDTAGHGIAIFGDWGTTSVTVDNSLIENTVASGIATWSSSLTVANSVIRDVVPHPSALNASRALSTESEPNFPDRAQLTLTHSLLERARGFGVSLWASDATIESTLVRDITPYAVEPFDGQGLNVEADVDTGERSNAVVTGSVFERNHYLGIRVRGSDLQLIHSAVRDTRAGPQGEYGRGIESSDLPAGVRPDVSVIGSVVERNIEVGIMAQATRLTLQGSVVRDTMPQAVSASDGNGVVAQASLLPNGSSELFIDGCIIERNHDIGVAVLGSIATIERLLVRDTREEQSDNSDGVGIWVQFQRETNVRAAASISNSSADGNHGFGLLVANADVAVDRSSFRNTAPAGPDARFGDGVVVLADDQDALVELFNSTIEDNGRAGLTMFGGTATLSGCALSCNAFAIDGEAYKGRDFTLNNQGDNSCACGDDGATCKVTSTGVQPPAALPDRVPTPP